MFWNNYVRLCRRYGFTPTGVGRKLGLSKGTVSNWKYGGYPRADNLIKIAQFFHITVEELEGVLVLDTDDSKSYDIDFKEIDNLLGRSTRRFGKMTDFFNFLK